MDLYEIHKMWIVRDGEEEITFGLPETSKNMKTENIMFLSKRIVENKGQNTPGSQLAVTKDVLTNAYTGQLNNGSKGKNFNGEEKDIYIPSDSSKGSVATGEFSITLVVEEGKLILKEANMSKELFESIKNTEGAESNNPYYITVTDGSKANPKTKLARIAFELNGEEVKATLVNLK